MKIITWNMGYWQHKALHEEAWEYIRRVIQPDLALLQEAKPPMLDDDEFLLLKEIHGGWGTAVYTRNMPLEELIFRGYPGRVAAARTVMAGVTIIYVSVHAPIIGGRVFPHLDRIFDEIAVIVENESFIVGGDLNSARLAEKVWPGYGHGPFWNGLSESPFFDCMMKFHEEEQQTYFRSDVSRPWQDDHLFVSHDLADRIVSCSVLKNEITRKCSDHIPIVSELKYD